jgi:hypothetical protein
MKRAFCWLLVALDVTDAAAVVVADENEAIVVYCKEDAAVVPLLFPRVLVEFGTNVFVMMAVAAIVVAAVLAVFVDFAKVVGVVVISTGGNFLMVVWHVRH